MASYETRTRRFSRVEYERLIDLGIFQPGEEIELIGGQLLVAEPQGAAHYTAVVKTAMAHAAGSTGTEHPGLTIPALEVVAESSGEEG